MAKTIIKQILISLLLCTAIGLVLAVIFYKFIPSNKIVPSKVTAYQTPENIALEINDNITEKEFQAVNQTYEITDSDLSLYKKMQSYNPGKPDPFAEYSSNSTTSKNNTTSGETGVSDKNTTDNYYTSANISSGTK